MTFAAGLAAQGMRPFCAIYSTFLQRAFDQVVHDVAIQNLPVRFAIDRAGLVGADGATHAGSFDMTYLGDPAQFRGHGRGRRGRTGPHDLHRGLHDDRARSPSATRAATGPASALPETPRAARDRQGPDRPPRQQDRAALARHAPGRSAQGGRPARRQGPVDHRGRPALRQAARLRADPQAAGHARSRRDDRGRPRSAGSARTS